MDYAEASYFDGYHFHHLGAWQEHRRLTRLADRAKRAARSLFGLRWKGVTRGQYPPPPPSTAVVRLNAQGFVRYSALASGLRR